MAGRGSENMYQALAHHCLPWCQGSTTIPPPSTYMTTKLKLLKNFIFLNISYRGWRNHLAVMCTGCRSRGPRLSSQHQPGLYNSSPRGPTPLLTSVDTTYMCTNKNKTSKLILKRKFSYVYAVCVICFCPSLQLSSGIPIT